MRFSPSFDDRHGIGDIDSLRVAGNHNRVYLFRSELEAIAREMSLHPRRETGGDLYGLHLRNGDPIILLSTGPGPRAHATSSYFQQDYDYYREVAIFLFNNYGLNHLGTWHSHHTLGFNFPSGGDTSSAREAVQIGSGWDKIVVMIGKHELQSRNMIRTTAQQARHYSRQHILGESVEEVNLRSFLFYRDGKEMGNRVGVIPSLSPMRNVFGNKFNSYNKIKGIFRAILPKQTLPEKAKDLSAHDFSFREPLASRLKELSVLAVSNCSDSDDTLRWPPEPHSVFYIYESEVNVICNLVQSGERFGNIYGLLTHMHSAVIISVGSQGDPKNRAHNLYESYGLEHLGMWCSEMNSDNVDNSVSDPNDISNPNDKLVLFTANREEIGGRVSIRGFSSLCTGKNPVEGWIVVLPTDTPYQFESQKLIPSKNFSYYIKYKTTIEELHNNARTVEVDKQTEQLLEVASPYVAELQQYGIDVDLKLQDNNSILVLISINSGVLSMLLTEDFSRNGPDITFIKKESHHWGVRTISDEVSLPYIGVRWERNETLLTVYQKFMKGFGMRETKRNKSDSHKSRSRQRQSSVRSWLKPNE